jgi:hypothetical protein
LIPSDSLLTLQGLQSPISLVTRIFNYTLAYPIRTEYRCAQVLKAHLERQISQKRKIDRRI